MRAYLFDSLDEVRAITAAWGDRVVYRSSWLRTEYKVF
jgi:hypothetical protein